MNTRSMTAALALMIVPAVLPGQTPNGSTGTAIERMPEALETRWALSALPPALRDKATVLVLDPATGYQTARQGTNGLTCFVERTAWELVDFRNDIYIPLCYDPAGAKTLLKVKMEVAVLRAQGMRADALKAEVERRYRINTYRAPERPGVAYMTSPVFRTVGPPDMQVHTMAMPHLMFYAPFVTNEDIAAAPNIADMPSLMYPFIDPQGIAQQSVMIQMVGHAETAAIVAREKALVDDLCAYRDILCLRH